MNQNETNLYTMTTYNVSDVLTHYGILGMKWGVRKDPKQAYSKASDKLRKLDEKYTQAEAKRHRGAVANADALAKQSRLDQKLSKAKAKATKSRYKADTAILFPEAKEKKARKLERKYNRLEYKATQKNPIYLNKIAQQKKLDSRALKAQRKAEKWYKSMHKAFSNTNLSDMNSDDVALGERYAKQMHLTRKSFNKKSQESVKKPDEASRKADKAFVNISNKLKAHEEVADKDLKTAIKALNDLEKLEDE